MDATTAANGAKRKPSDPAADAAKRQRAASDEGARKRGLEALRRCMRGTDVSDLHVRDDLGRNLAMLVSDGGGRGDVLDRSFALEGLALSGLDIDAADLSGTTALMLCCGAGACGDYFHFGISKLLELGCRADVRDGAGRTALHHLCRARPSRLGLAIAGRRGWEGMRWNLALALLRAGASPNVVDARGRSPLAEECAGQCFDAMVRDLLNHGSALNTVDAEGDTPCRRASHTASSHACPTGDVMKPSGQRVA